MRIILSVLNIIRKLLIYALRGVAIYSIVGSSGEQKKMLITFLVVEWVAAWVSLLRSDEDTIWRNTVGFIGDDDVGFFSYTDNSGLRFAGILALIVSYIFKGILIFTLVKMYML